MKNGTFDNTLMFLASPQLRYEMSQIHIEHPVFGKTPTYIYVLPTFLAQNNLLCYLLHL